MLGNLFARSQEGVSTPAPRGARGGRQPRACSTATAAISSRASGDATSPSSTMLPPQATWVVRDPSGALPCYLRALPRRRHLLLLDRRRRRSPRCAARGQLALSDRGRQFPAGAFPWHRAARGHARFSRESASRRAPGVSKRFFYWDPLQIANTEVIEDLDAAVAAMRQCVRDVVHAWASCHDHLLAVALRRPRLLDRARDVWHGCAVAAAGDLLSLLSPRRRSRRARLRARRRRKGRPGADRAPPRLLLQPAAAAHHPPRAGADQLRLFPGAQPARRAARRRAAAPARSSSGMAAISSSIRSAPSGRPGISSTAAGCGPACCGWRSMPRRWTRSLSGRVCARLLPVTSRTGAGAFCRRRGGCGRCSCRRWSRRRGAAPLSCIRCCVIRGARRAASSGTRTRSASRSISMIRWGARAMRSGCRRSSHSRSWSSVCAFQLTCSRRAAGTAPWRAGRSTMTCRREIRNRRNKGGIEEHLRLTLEHNRGFLRELLLDGALVRAGGRRSRPPGRGAVRQGHAASPPAPARSSNMRGSRHG